MFYAITWVLVLFLLALWSLGVWALTAAGSWTLAHAGALSGSSAAVEGLQLPAWLAPWVPPEIAASITALMSGLAPTLEAVLNQAPALAGGLTVAAWVLWGLGSALLVGLGLLAHVLIAVMRRRGAASPPGAGGMFAGGSR